MSLLTRLTSDAIFHAAFTWLCRQRRDWPAHAEVWDLRRHWPRSKRDSGTYALQLLSPVTLADGTEIDLWAARDVLVLKVIRSSARRSVVGLSSTSATHGG